MEWTVQSVLLHILLCITAALSLIYFYMTQNYNYWKKKNVPHASPTFPFGNIKDLVMVKTHLGKLYQQFYKEFKGFKFAGIYEGRKPTLIILDFDLAWRIMVKDFDYFKNRALPPAKGVFSRCLVKLKDDEWKEMRLKMNALFSTRSLKSMFDEMHKCSEKLNNRLDKIASNNQTLHVKNIITCYTIDTTTTCIFGVESNDSNYSESDFMKASKFYLNVNSVSKWFFIRSLFMECFPIVFKLLPQSTKTSEFYLNFVKKTVESRLEMNIERNDLFEALKTNTTKMTKCENIQDVSNDDTYTLNAAAMAYELFESGYETSAVLISFILHEMALDPDLQRKVQNEVDEVLERHGGSISYDSLQDMGYMNQVINETIRCRRSNPMVARRVGKPYRIPDTEVVVDKGVKVVIPIYAFHNDPEVYPNPDLFDPERFSKENISLRHRCAFIPFGEGPRMCVAKQFGIVQVKLAVATIASRFEVKLSSGTATPNISSKSFMPKLSDDIQLTIVKRSSK